MLLRAPETAGKGSKIDFWIFTQNFQKKIMGFFPNFANENRKLWGFSEILQMKIENYGVFRKFCKWKSKIMGFFRNFTNENRKLWGFHLQKPHNPKFQKKNYGVFPNENPIIFDFHLQKSKILVFDPKNPKKWNP